MNNISKTDIKYIEIAAGEATKSTETFRHGCVAVSSGKIIAKGYNHNRTVSQDGLISSMVCSCHAEIDVLRKCLKQNITHKISLYIARIGNGNAYLSSIPCGECYKQMQKFHIKCIIYTENDGSLTKIRMSNFQSNYKSSGYKAIEEKKVKCF